MVVALFSGDSFIIQMMPVLGVLLILMSVLMGIRKRRRRQANQVTAREQLERGRDQRAVRGDLESLMVELEQMSRRLASQLDAKSIQLERLIAQADERIEAMKRADQHQNASPTPDPGEKADASGREGPDHEPQRLIKATPTAPTASTLEEVSAALSHAVEATSHSDGGSEPPDDAARAVYELADAGHSPTQIAQQLDDDVGKIELILALRDSS